VRERVNSTYTCWWWFLRCVKNTRRYYDSVEKHALDDSKEEQQPWCVWIIFNFHSWAGRCFNFSPSLSTHL